MYNNNTKIVKIGRGAFDTTSALYAYYNRRKDSLVRLCNLAEKAFIKYINNDQEVN